MGDSRTCGQDGQTGREEAGRQIGTGLCQAEVKMHPEDNGKALEGFSGEGCGKEMSSPRALPFPFVPKSSVYIQDLALPVIHRHGPRRCRCCRCNGLLMLLYERR